MNPTPINPSINGRVKVFKPKQSIPRNKLARGDNRRDKLGVNKIINDTTGVLKGIFAKHAIGHLDLSESKLISNSGEVTFLEQDEIVGNMRASILVVKSKSINVAKDYEYDLVKIERDKIEREAKNKRDEQERTLLELERLRKADEDKNIETAPDSVLSDALSTTEPVVPDVVTEVEQPVTSNVVTEAVQSITQDVMTEAAITDVLTTTQTLETDVSQEEIPELEPVAKRNKKKERITRATREKRDKAITDLKKQLEKKSYPNLEVSGNKHLRNFIADVQKKFYLEPLKDYKYFDIKSNTTMMIIEQARVYRIVLPDCIKDIYHVIVGDLQLKSALVQKIDPGYDSSELYKAHTDFIERIKAKENAKISEHNPDTLEKEDFIEAENQLSEDDEIITDLLDTLDKEVIEVPYEKKSE